jgi:(2Fe-2S) ferredoxin
VPDLDLQILVCVNDRGAEAPRPSCAQGDGLAVYHRLKDLVRERGLRDRVMITRTGCLRRCSHGVTVVAWPGPRWHAGVAPDDAAELFDALRAGDTLPRLAMPDGAWE